jgi:hypothetical protein
MSVNQQIDMLNHWSGLTTGNLLDPATRLQLNSGKINVTGHSLAGHLTTFFANDRPYAHNGAATAPCVSVQNNRYCRNDAIACNGGS